MNLLIFNPAELNDKQLIVSGYQHEQIIKTLKCKVGDTLKIGALNGNIGTATIIEIRKDSSIVEVTDLNTTPPPCLNLSLIVALPRPQMLKRILQTIATMGVQAVHFIQSSRVEKSFWQSPVLQEEEIHRQLVLGLEQGMATQCPKIILHQRFIPFIEDELPKLTQNKRCFIAEPGPHAGLLDISKNNAQQETAQNLFAIGPEGGFLEQEVARFTTAGFTPITLGERILKVETAVTVVAAAFLTQPR